MNDKIGTENRTKKTPFAGWNKINRTQKTFTAQKIRRAGKDIDLQEYTNENNKDCTIYDVYATYRGDKKLTVQALNTLTHKVSDELMEIKDLPTAFEVMKYTERSWRELPMEVRKEFNNNVNNFQKNGLNWANNKIKAYNDKIKAEKAKAEELIKAKTTETTTIKGA